MSASCRSLAQELKAVMRLAGRDPEQLEGRLPTLSALHRVATAEALDEPARVHFIVYRLIPEYLQRLPGGRDCRAICELLRWQDDDGQLLSLTTRYHKAALHLVSAASDFGRRQEPRLLRECARRFIAFDHEDHLSSPPATRAVAAAVPAAQPRSTPRVVTAARGAEDGFVRVHPNLDYHRLTQYIAAAQKVVILNTWIPGIDLLADALADAIARGSEVSILLLHPDSHIAQLRSHALQATTQARFRQDMVRPGITHCLDVLAAVSQMVDEQHRGHLRVRLYDTLPSISLYAIDERAFISAFTHGHLAVKSLQIELLGQDSLMGRWAFQETAHLWNLGDEIADISQRRNDIKRPRPANIAHDPHPRPTPNTQPALVAEPGSAAVG